MIRTVMVPLDGSPFGEWALPHALTIADRTGAVLDLVSVHVPYSMMPTPDGSGFDVGMDEAARRGAEEYLAAVRARIGAVRSVDVRTTVRCGGVRESLLEQAESAKADLIVMTTHGRGPLRRVWLGSVADGMVRHAAQPILLMRPEEEGTPDPAEDAPFHHILIPLDGSAEAEQILGIALELADLAEAQCTAVRVVQPPFVPVPYGILPPPPVNDGLVRELCAGAEAYLADVGERMSRAGRNVDTHVIVEPSVASAVLSAAHAGHADLIALATHGRGPVGRMFLGSVADKIVRGADTAVLLCRPRTS